jgi:hypothetical protein
VYIQYRLNEKITPHDSCKRYTEFCNKWRIAGKISIAVKKLAPLFLLNQTEEKNE